MQQYDDDDNGSFLGLAVELRLAHNVVSPVQGVNNGVNFRREVFACGRYCCSNKLIVVFCHHGCYTLLPGFTIYMFSWINADEIEARWLKAFPRNRHSIVREHEDANVGFEVDETLLVAISGQYNRRNIGVSME